jgi:hypothetical protein
LQIALKERTRVESKPKERVKTSVVLVNDLGLTLHVTVKLCKFILYCLKQCKNMCKNKYNYMILHGYVKKCKY